jgi:tetratricopeptide (TPR) repeat protein
MKTFPGCPPLILLFIALATLLMQAQNPSAPALSADEEIVRELTERYYLDFEKRDFEDQHAMWSPRSTDDSSKRRSYETWVKLKVEKFVVENVRVTGDQARVRITVHLSGVSAKTGKPLGGWLNRDVRLTHKLVKEDRNWLLLWQVPTDEDIVESVLAARNDKERQAIMAADKVVADREFISNYASAALGGPVKISPESSVDNLKFALKLAEQANADEEIGLINGYLGNSYMLLGDHALALIADMKARDISEKRGDARDVANAFNSIGVDYDNLGDPERALESYQKSVATVVPGIVPDSRFTRLSGNIAGTLLQMGRYDEAKSAYEKLLSFSTEKNLRHDTAAAYQGLCTVYSELGDLQRALGYCTKAEKECEEEKDPGQMAGIASKSAEVNYLLGNFDEALRLSGRIADLSNSLGYKDDASWRADMVAAQTLIALGKPDEAKGRLESAIRTVETFGDRALGG